MCIDQLEDGELVDLKARGNQNGCKFYWFSEQEAAHFRARNERQTSKNEKFPRLEVNGIAFTKCTETPSMPSGYEDYKLVFEGEGTVVQGESWQ